MTIMRLHNTHPLRFADGVKKADYKGFRGYLHHAMLHDAKAL